jgi:hypothetical protein
MRALTTALMLAGLAGVAAGDDEKPKADPAASKLLAEARDARATWDHFPGFTADVAVNIDGRLHKGKVTVDKDGSVTLTGPEDKEALAFAKRMLGSVAGHRMPASEPLDTPCAFPADDAHHPLGRMVRVLNDEYHSSYRIRDKQIMVVNRVMKDQRFTITVLENTANAEGKFLPASFVVNYWNAATGELVKTDANVQTWKRVGKFDLPVEARVITAAKGGDKPELSARSVTLSNHALADTTARK